MVSRYCDLYRSDGAGHYVKMVHNGIEYGDMQLIAQSLLSAEGRPEPFQRRTRRDLHRVEQRAS